MTAKDLYEIPLKEVSHKKLLAYMPALHDVDANVFDEDVLNVNGCYYYQWLPQVIKYLLPKQVVELGGAMGLSALMMLQELDKDSKLYSITLAENGLEFSYIKENYSNLIKVIGDDLDLNNWPKDLDLNRTDLWFFDSLHTKEQLEKELELYSVFFKKGAVLLFDDIHLNKGMEEVWEELTSHFTESYDGTDPLHYSGFGIIVV